MDAENKRVMVAVSGGMDSMVLAYKLVKDLGKDNVILGHVSWKQSGWYKIKQTVEQHANKLRCELHVAPFIYPSVVTNAYANILTDLGVVKTIEQRRAIANSYEHPFFDMHEKTELFKEAYIPGLGTIIFTLLGAMAVACKCSELALGFVANDDSRGPSEFYTDISNEFVAALNIIKQPIWGISAANLTTPLVEMSKAKVALLGVELGCNVQATTSCDVYPACGVCTECLLRAEALHACGLYAENKFLSHSDKK